MMSEIEEGKWNLRQSRQEHVEGEERNRSSHVQTQQNPSYVVPMSNNYEVAAELTWENGQLSMHGLRGINVNPPQPKQTWVNNKPGDSTLESLVHQATTFTNNNFNATNKYSTPLMPANNITTSSADEKWGLHEMDHINPECSLSSMAESSGAANWREKYSSSHMQVAEQRIPVKVQTSMPMVPPGGICSSASLLNKRVRSETERYCNVNGRDQERERGTMSEPSACASASAALCGDGDATMMMTWASFESPPRSFKTARNADDDSASHDCSENQEGDRVTKRESFRSHSSARRSRAAAIHNQSERRRRDRINEKMKALQKLVPNASKTDKASMLDEVIEYLKQLQAQVQMMSNARNMPQMVMPLGMQQQLQLSLLARMGMGMGMTPMGMIDVNNLARNSLAPLIHTAASLGGSAPSFVPPPFAMQTPMAVPSPAQLKPNTNPANMNGSAVPNFNEAYNTLLAQQSMNMDFFNKMAALYRQQANFQASKKPVNLSSLPRDATQ